MKFTEWLQSKEKVLAEMPIGNAALLGKWNNFPPNTKQHQSWDKASYNILTNDVNFEKLKNRWSRVRQTFDMYFVKNSGMSKQLQVGAVYEDYLKKLGIKIPPINYDHITVFFTNNIGSERVPMTPWTIGHRFGHAIFSDIPLMKQFHEILEHDFANLLKTIYNIHPVIKTYGDNYYKEKKQHDKFLIKLMSAFGTMRSAREGLINRLGEFTFELLGQFILDGKITFNEEIPKQLITSYAWGRPKWDGTAYSRIHNDESMIDHVIDTLQYNAEEYNKICDKMLDRCVGKIFVM